MKVSVGTEKNQIQSVCKTNRPC